MKKIEIAQGEDWVCVFVDEKLFYEGHSFQEIDFIRFVKHHLPEVDLLETDLEEDDDWYDDEVESIKVSKAKQAQD